MANSGRRMLSNHHLDHMATGNMPVLGHHSCCGSYFLLPMFACCWPDVFDSKMVLTEGSSTSAKAVGSTNTRDPSLFSCFQCVFDLTLRSKSVYIKPWSCSSEGDRDSPSHRGPVVPSHLQTGIGPQV